MKSLRTLENAPTLKWLEGAQVAREKRRGWTILSGKSNSKQYIVNMQAAVARERGTWPSHHEQHTSPRRKRRIVRRIVITAPEHASSPFSLPFSLNASAPPHLDPHWSPRVQRLSGSSSQWSLLVAFPDSMRLDLVVRLACNDEPAVGPVGALYDRKVPGDLDRGDPVQEPQRLALRRVPKDADAIHASVARKDEVLLDGDVGHRVHAVL